MPVVLSKPVDQLIKNYDTPGRRVVTADRVYVRPWGPLTKSNSRFGRSILVTRVR